MIERYCADILESQLSRPFTGKLHYEELFCECVPAAGVGGAAAAASEAVAPVAYDPAAHCACASCMHAGRPAAYSLWAPGCRWLWAHAPASAPSSGALFMGRACAWCLGRLRRVDLAPVPVGAGGLVKVLDQML